MNLRRDAFGKLRKRIMPYVIVLDGILILIVSLIPNFYQYSLTHNSWYWILGLLSLAYLAYIEKQRDLPFPFLERREEIPYWYYPLFGLLALLLFPMISRMLWWIGLTPYSIVMRSSAELVAVIAYEGIVGITEESFKVAFTNLFARLFHVRRSKARLLVVTGAGTLAVGVWAYLHVLEGHNWVYGLDVFLGGMVIYIIVYYLKNYVPTTIAHTMWNTLIDLFF